MIFSSACEYGIRAMAYLAEHGKDGRVLVREVSEQETIPGPFLGKVFQTLVKAGLLTSAKGPGGGFSLAKNASEISLFDIRAAIDGVKDLDGCAAGLAQCSDDTPCPLHDSWKPIRKSITAYLTVTTLADMAVAVRKKKKLLARGRA